MSAGAIYSALASYLEPDGQGGQQIDLFEASGDPELVGLGAALALFGITSSYVITAVTLSQPTSDSVKLVGQGSFNTPGATDTQSVGASLDASAPDGTNLFELALALAVDDWTFSSFFPELPPCQQYDETSQTVVWVSSFLVDLPLSQAVFSGTSAEGAPLQLGGDLPPEGTLSAYEALFPSWPLHLEGSVVLGATPEDPPILDLKAISPTTSIAFGNVSAQQVGLRLSTEVDLDVLESPEPAVSYLDLIGSLYFGDASSPLTLSVPLLAVSRTWRLLVQAEPGAYRIGDQIAAVAAILGLTTDQLIAPPGLDVFNDFYLTEVEFSMPALTNLSAPQPAATEIAVTLASDQVWAPPIPFVRVRDVGMRWLIGYLAAEDGGTLYISGAVWGGITIGPEQAPTGGPALQGPDPEPDPDESFTVDIEGLIPQFVVTGNLRESDTIPIGSAFRHFFGDPGPPTPSDMAVTAFELEAGPLTRTFRASATVTTDWTLQLTDAVAIKMIGLLFEIDVSQASVYGAITGTILLEGGSSGDEAPEFMIRAEYRNSEASSGWVFDAALAGQTPVSINALVINLLGIDPPPTGLPSLDIVAMGWRYETETLAYWASGTIEARWVLTVFGDTLNLSASATAEVSRPDGTTAPSGRLSGTFSVNKLALTVARDIGVTEPTYLFRVQFGEASLTAVTSWTGEGDDRHQVITVQLGGVTLGSVLEYLVNLAAPTIGFQLDPPWDVLNQVDLSRFELTIDPTDNVIELTYRLDLNIVVMEIEKVGVRYQSNDGVGSVRMILDGSFLGTEYSGDDALSWDVVKDPPPAVPGQNETLIDLRYIGVGQRITFADPGDLQTVKQTLDLLRQDMRPPTSTDQNPLDHSAMVFSADSEWLLGLDVGLMETVDLGIIFNDPVLYGLYLQLGGEKAGSLSGLYFEILYKKITDDVGMYRIELRVPEVFRHIELGEVSITLGVIVVEIYTNGNFLVDLGFPYERNFDRAFTVQVFPFIGRGGIYFGVLDGDTSRRVPQITNGNFAPVLELGVGLAVGVGKEVSVGPLSGGIYVEVEVLFQGVLGWFNPTSSGVEPAKYYWVQGVAAIHGKLYGSVDFKVIKVSVTLEASAEVSVVLEAYQPTVFRLAVSVTVKAKVKVLFVTVHFSFGVDLDVSFSVGSAAATPWILGSGGSSGEQRSLRRGGSLHRVLPNHLRTRRALRQHHLLRYGDGSLRAGEAEGTLNWDPNQQVLSEPSEPVPVTLLPAFSATEIPLSWTGTAPSNPDPAYRVAMLLFADNGIAADADTIAATRERSTAFSAHANDVSELPAAILAEAFLRWAIFAVTNPAGSPDPSPTTVTAGQTDLLLAEMDDARTANEGFSIANLEAFLETNITLQVSGDPGGDPEDKGAMAIPVPPALTMTWQGDGSGTVNFAEKTPVGALYEAGATAYMASFATLGFESDTEAEDDPADYESFATFIFRDWCLMLTKAAVQAADDEMQSWELETTEVTSLDDVAATFPEVDVNYRVRWGDTVDNVALVLGVTPAELEYCNENLQGTLDRTDVGGLIQVKLGVAPEVLATDNAALTLVGGTWDFGDLAYQIKHEDTFDSIAEVFGFPDAAALFDNPALAPDRQVLAYGADFHTEATDWTMQAGFDVLLSAAVFFVRFYTPLDVPDAEWYTQTVFDWNQDVLKDASIDGELPPNLALQVPPRLNDTDQDAAITYTTVPGDTVHRIGSALSLAQNYGTSTEGPVAGWPEFRDAVQPSGTDTVSLPVATMTIQSGETPDALAQRTLVFGGAAAGDPPNVDGLLDWIGDKPILNPLGVVELPGYHVDTSRYPSFGAIAEAFDLDPADVGGRLFDKALLPASSAMVVKRLPVQSIDTLVERVLAGPLLSQVSGMSSRFLLAGLRLPAPEDDGGGHVAATGPMTSILDLSGQQFAGPAIPAEPDAQAVPILTVGFQVNAGVTWIELMESAAVAESDALHQRYPEVARHNRRLATGGTVPSGTIVQTGETDSLGFAYTASQLEQLYPVPSLGVDPTSGPEPIPLADDVPKTYGLDHRIELQSPIPLAIPVSGESAMTGNASLWPFSVDLEGLARAESDTPWEIVSTADRRTTTGSGGEGDEILLDATFGCVLDIVVQRIDALGNVYELLGSTTTTSQTMLSLWQYLAKQGATGTEVYVLVAPAPDAGNAQGVTVLQVDDTSTSILKTNLSTETVPGLPEEGQLGAGRAARDEEGTTWFASLDQLTAFLTLLWEGTAVGGTGYFLSLETSSREGLPENLFDERGQASLRLLVIPAAQQDVAPEGRPLLAFNNCALVQAGLDPAIQALYAEAADNSDLTKVALVPPGNVGFALTLPEPTEGTAEQASIDQLFSLLSYAVGAKGELFYDSRPGPPVTPEADDGTGLPLWRKRRLKRRARARGAEEPDPALSFWKYGQVIPIARMGPTSEAPAVKGLPEAAEDPYRGVGGQETVQEADIQLGFGDILGNVTAAPGEGEEGGLVRATVGYTDPVLPATSWPGAATGYTFGPKSGGATLDISVSLQAGTLTAGLLQPPSLAAESAARVAETYRDVYYQLAQPALTVSAWTTLVTGDAGTPEPIVVDGAGEALWRFAAGAYAYAVAAAGLEPVRPFATEGGDLAHLETETGLNAASFAAVNAAQDTAALFGQTPLQLPAHAVFAEQKSISFLAPEVPPPGWPHPTAEEILSMSENATVLPLRPGIALTTPAGTVTVPDSEVTLAQLSADHHTSPALLAEDNAADTEVLKPGFTFGADGQEVVVDDPGVTSEIRSFNDVVAAFAAIGVQRDVAQLATDNASQTGMFIAEVSLTNAHYLVPEPAPDEEPDTLAANASGYSVEELAQANVNTINIFDAGALVYLGDFDPATPDGTLREFADQYASTPEIIMADLASSGFTLPAGSTLTTPGMVTLPEDTDAVNVPYTIQTGDTLTSVTDRFAYSQADQAVTQLATDNGAMPGVLVAGVDITVTSGGQTATTRTETDDSLDAVLARLQTQVAAITMADLAASIADTTDLLAAEGLFICPLALLPASAITPDGIASSYGITAAAFGQANQALRGLVAPGVELTVSDTNGTPTSITTGADYTLNAVLAQFANAGTETSVSQIMAENPTAQLFLASAKTLLPPSPVLLSADLGAAGSGPFGEPVFALTVGLWLQRPAALVSPDFRTPDGDGPVERGASLIPSPVSPEYRDATSISLDTFADGFMTTFPDLRLGTGRVGGVASELWVVVFTDGGITDLSVSPGVTMPEGQVWPRYFAIRPLYTDLIHRSLRLQEVQADGTLVQSEDTTDLRGIDVEVWAVRFLAAVDLFLAAPYGPGVQAANPDALTAVLEGKSKLVQGIAAGLGQVLQVEDPRSAEGRAAAMTELEQHLGISLSKGYATNVALQYDASVESAWTAGTLLPARVDGDPRIPDTAATQADPGYVLTNAKTPLDETNSFVTFLMTVDDVETTTDVSIDPEYELTHLEFGIQPIQVDPETTYDASNWLTFVPALAGTAKPATVHTDLGSAIVPVPLRYYPGLPVFKGQDASADATAPTLADAATWRHGVAYTHEHAAQDEVLLTTTYNLTDGGLARLAAEDQPDVAAALAQYNNTADKLWQLLSYYADPATGDATTAANAAASFADLVEGVASAWQDYWPTLDAGTARLAADGGTGWSFDFRLRLTYTGQEIQSLVIEALQAEPGPVGQWPFTVYTAPSGRVVELGQGTDQEGLRVYTFPTDEPVPAAAWAGIRLEWRELSTATLQNATAEVSVQRNRLLLPPEDEVPTSQAFVFSTGVVSAPGLTTPLVEWPDPFDISELGTTVEEALGAAFTQLFGDAMEGLPVTLQLSYGFQLVAASEGDPEGLRTVLPVALYPDQPLDANTAGAVAAVLQEWQDAQHPQTTGGAWIFGLTQFSQLTTNDRRALLSLRELVFYLS